MVPKEELKGIDAGFEYDTTFVRLRRGANGEWFAEILLKCWANLPDGRKITFGERTVVIGKGVQSGRKPIPETRGRWPKLIEDTQGVLRLRKPKREGRALLPRLAMG
jgi:hypothetical protein